jgi:predicted DCC family thiol-disulfide oxidoreductase YuxK
MIFIHPVDGSHRNGWTGGQYSVLRAAFGLFLAADFAADYWRGSERHWFWIVIRALIPLFFAFGSGGRWTAAFLLFICADIAEGMGSRGRAPFAALVAIPLVAHLFLPPAPYGSVPARGRVDPDGGWRFPPRLLLAVRAAAAVVDVWLVARAAGGSNVLGLLVPALFVNLLACDPGWIRGTYPCATDTVFFDGTCGLCHRGVRLALAEDRAGTTFRFAPLGGQLWREKLGDRPGLPDSMVVLGAGGETFLRSRAVLHTLKRLGGLWRVLASVMALVPRPLRDAVYDLIARVRYRLFGRAKEACPLLPPELRSRFVA